MRTWAIALHLFLLFIFMCSCKKGENDPSFTLLSRKERVAGSWKMTEGTVTLGFKDSSGVYPAELYKLGEGSYTRSVLSRGANFSGDHSLAIQTTKNGNFIMQQKLDAVSFEFSGKWQFEGKGSGSKNKERISVKLDKANNSSGYYVIFNKSLITFKYKIKELRDKKMVLFCNEEMLDLNSNYGIYVTAEYTFVQ